MLSVFPELFTYDILAITLLRVVVGIVLLYIGLITVGVRRIYFITELQVHNFARNYNFHRFLPWVMGLVEIFTGVFITVGFLTQVMVLIAAYLFLNMTLIEKYVGKVLNYPIIFNVVMIFLSLALLFLGPGAFAIDLPL